MTELPSAVAPASRPEIKVRTISEADLNWALAEGWSDFRDRRGDLIVLALIYPIIAFATVAIAFDTRLLPLLFPAVAGLSILGPAVASGFYELARRREAGLDASWTHFLDPLHGQSRFPLLVLTCGLFVLFLCWLGAAGLVYQSTLALWRPTATEFFSAVISSTEGWRMILIGNLVGFAFAVATLCFAFISFPMVVDRDVDPFLAVATSLAAARANPRTTASWGLRVALLLALGCLPAFIGLAVVLPVLGYASWHLYTRAVVR